MTQMKQTTGFVADTADLDLGLAESPPWRWRERPEKLDRWATRFRASQQTFPLESEFYVQAPWKCATTKREAVANNCQVSQRN